MSQITSSVGLISGINTEDIISQLISLEQRPIRNIERRNETLQSQQTAFQEINSRLLGLRSSADNFATQRTFQSTTASSSNESVLTASSNNTAIPGNTSFRVAQLVSGQQTVTNGFADRNATPVGEGTLTFDRGESRLSRRTELAQLNGGRGIERGEIRITDRSGASTLVDLSAAITVDDVIEKINDATGVNVIASAQGDRFVLEDASGSTAGDLLVAEVGGSTTAADLGLSGTSSTATLEGDSVNRIGADTALSLLNDGNGVEIRQNLDDFSIDVAGGTTHNINLESAQTLGDVIDAINDQTGGDVTASVNPNGNGVQLVDNTGTGGLAITELNSKAATDLGLTLGTTSGDTLTGSRVVAAMNSTLLRNLNGGDGVAAGSISVTNSANATTSVDLSAARSVSEVLDAVNASGAGVTARLNDSGNGIALIDEAGGTGDLVIAEDGSTTAADLGLVGTFADGKAESGNLQYRYVTNNTSLENLGIRQGKFLIRDANGASATIDLTQNESNVGDVIREINGITNALGVEVDARINDNGDGIELLDTATSGASGILVQGVEGTTAEDLGILGAAENPGDSISGSFEQSIEITDTDTLEDVVQKINDAGVAVSAGIINDGSAGNAFRLSLTSKGSGTDSAFVFDDEGMGFGARNFSEAQDAVVFFGSDPTNSLALTSSSNRLQNVIPGVDIDLKSVSEQPVQLTINRDTEAITSAAESFVESFNSLVDSINKHDSFNAETEERGLLLGDSTVARIRSSVYNAVINPNREIPGQFNSLSEVGIRVGEGAKLRFDSDEFLAAFAEDPEGVEQLFTFEQTEENADGEETVVAQGIGKEISELLKSLTDAQGPLQRRVDTLEGQVQLNQDRIESLQESVEAKRERLEREFTQMELALAQIQDQQSALSQLANLAGGGGGGGGSSLGSLGGS